MARSKSRLTQYPEELIYRTQYAPLDLHAALATAEARARIRHLPGVHLFFGLKDLDDDDVGLLLPHVTAEQWTAVLDLDLWSRDRASMGRFVHWQRHLILAQAAVGRKLAGAADAELWELVFKRLLKIHAKVDDDVESETREGEWLATPDGRYLIVLPGDAEQARLLRALLLRLYELDPGWTALLLEEARARTTLELEESAYRSRTGRLEELGFPSYYDALEIYSAPSSEKELRSKAGGRPVTLTTLPAQPLPAESGSLLLFQAAAHMSRSWDVTPLLEEILSVCNKVLAADRVSPASSDWVRKAIRKALAGMNLGLDCWSEGDLNRAAEGLQRYLLLSFFQLGYARLMELRKSAVQAQRGANPPEAGSFLDVALRSLSRRYPLLAVPEKERVRKRFFTTRGDLRTAEGYLKQMGDPR